MRGTLVYLLYFLCMLSTTAVRAIVAVVPTDVYTSKSIFPNLMNCACATWGVKNILRIRATGESCVLWVVVSSVSRESTGGPGGALARVRREGPVLSSPQGRTNAQLSCKTP